MAGTYIHLGLVNGTRGVVKKIWYKQGTSPSKDLPAVVFVDVNENGYTGKRYQITIYCLCSYYLKGPDNPCWDGIDPRWIPIVPVTARWEKGGKNLTRTQLPLCLAWAITIHKSQGLTLLKAVIDLGPKDFSAGLSFVAISRVKTLKGIAFRTSFPHQRLQRTSETETMRLLKEDNQRRLGLQFQLDTYGVDLSEYEFLD